MLKSSECSCPLNSKLHPDNKYCYCDVASGSVIYYTQQYNPLICNIRRCPLFALPISMPNSSITPTEAIL